MNAIDFILPVGESINFEEVLLSDANKKALIQLLKEQTFQAELNQYNLPVDNKILLHGYSGCGKTSTAKAIAQTLGKNIFILDLSSIVSARIGETAKNVRAVFDKAAREKAVLFLDEFDQIGKMRTNDDKDVGEMRRLVNTIIQLIDYYPSDALLIAATNHVALLDTAILRRFQLRLKFEMPTALELDAYYTHLLMPFPKELRRIDRKYEISYAEAKDYFNTTMKAQIIHLLEQGKRV